MVVVEEGWPTCSIASEIIATVMERGFDDLDAPVLRVTNEDVPLPYAANLEKVALLKSEDVVAEENTRSRQRRVGNECDGTGIYGWSPHHTKKKERKDNTK